MLPGTESLDSACASGLVKLSATDGAGSAAKGGRHVPASRLLAKRRAVSARRTFPPGCGRVAVPQLAVQVPVTVESGRADYGSGVSERKEGDGDCSAADKRGTDVVATPVTVPQLVVQVPVTVTSGTPADDGTAVSEKKVAGGDCSAADKGGTDVVATPCKDEELEEGEIRSANVTVIVQASVIVKYGPADDGTSVSKKVAGGDCSAADKRGTDVVATPCEDEELEEGEIPPTKGHPVAQELLGSQVSVNVALFQPASCDHRTPVMAVSVVDTSASRSSDEKMGASRIQCADKNCSARNSSRVATASLSEGPSQEHCGGTRVSEIAKMDKGSAAVTGRGSVQGVKMRGKVMFTPQQTVKPAKPIQKSVADTQRAPFLENKDKENQLGRHMRNNEIQDADGFTKGQVQQGLKSSEKCRRIQGKEGATTMSYFGPRKKIKVKESASLSIKLIPMCDLGNKEKLNGKLASNLDGDDILCGVAIHDGTIELYLKNNSHIQSADARSRVMMMHRRFEVICTAIAQAVDQRSLKVRRIDLAAEKAMKELPDFSKPHPCVGSVPGVEIGDSFHYRVQLAIVGLHRPYQGGIDWTNDDNNGLVALSVVASRGYPDDLSSSGELIYSGSGGELADRSAGGDQKLERGNLALKNCIARKSPVRVIRGFKRQNAAGSHSRAKEIITFTYDGLYHVVACWAEGHPGSKVFKFKLKRIPGQPELLYGRKTGIMS